MQNGINSPKVHWNSACARMVEAVHKLESVFENVIYLNSMHLANGNWYGAQCNSPSEIKMFHFHDSSNNKSVKSAGAISAGNFHIKIAAKLFIFVAWNFSIYLGHSTLMRLYGSLSVRWKWAQSGICCDHNHCIVSKFINVRHLTGPEC